MKKKNVIFLSIVLSLLFLGIGVGAATMFNAKDISYTPSDEKWNVNNISDAVDDLYTKKDGIKTTGEAFLISLMDAYKINNPTYGKPYICEGTRVFGLDFSNIANITFYAHVPSSDRTMSIRFVNYDNSWNSVENVTVKSTSLTDYYIDISNVNNIIDAVEATVSVDGGFYRLFVKQYTRTDGTVVTADWAK